MVLSDRAPAPEPSGGEDLVGRGRPVGRRPGWLGSRHVASARARAVMAVLVAAGLAVATAVALREPPAARGTDPTVVGVALRIPLPRPAGAAVSPIRATYQVTAGRSGSSLQVLGLAGPFLLGTHVRTARTATTGTVRRVTVSAVADCRSPSALRRSDADYVLVGRLTRRGDPATVRRRVPTSTVDWAAAVRQDCWQRVAARGITVDDVAVELDAARGPLLVVRLASTLGRDVRIGAVDVADVSTLEAADDGVLAAGGSLVLRVRRPVLDCRDGPLPGNARTLPGAPSGLLWSVGPVAGDAAATFVTALPAAVTDAVGRTVRRLCAAARLP